MRHLPLFPFDDPNYKRPLRESVYRGARIRARPYYVVLRWCVRYPFRQLRKRIHAWLNRSGAHRDGNR